MNCSNCGAPLALADGRTILTCEYCLSSNRLNDPMDDNDRIVSLERPSGLNCPCCGDELMKAALDGKPASVCPACLGILVESPIFAEVVRDRRASFRGLEMPAPTLDPELFQRSIACPNCDRPMDVHHHSGAGRAVIDSCPQCHLVWLDQSEMTSLERTPGRR